MNYPSFLTQAPTRQSFRHPLVFCDATMADIKDWDTKIQPFVEAEPIRADKGWVWQKKWLQSWILGKSLGQEPAIKRLAIEQAQGPDITCALLIMAQSYKYPHNKEPAVYTWYVSAPPTSYFKSLNIEPPGLLTQMALDSAIMLSFQRGYDGKMWLHADPTNQQGLIDFYGKKCLMTPLPKQVALTRGTNDGGYFYYTKQGIIDFCKKFDAYR